MKVLLTKESIYEGDLILINSSYPIRKENTSDLENYNNVLFSKRAGKYLQFVLKDIESGGKIALVSGYRSPKEQEQIYNDSLKENGQEFTEKYVAKVKHSEHQSGLAIDLALNEGAIDFLCPSFPYEGICQKFREKCSMFGFIQRYQKAKEKITRISEEEWHFRYVGYPHSKIITDNNFCLEEYIDFIRHYKEKNPLEIENFKVYFMPYEKDIEINLNYGDTISGNNVDGFIVTRIKNEN